MSWFARVYVLCAVVCSVGFAQRVSFSGTDTTIKLETRAVASRDAVAPLEVRLSIPAIEVEKDGSGYDAIRVKGMVPLDEAGRPDLATTGVMVAVPEGFDPRLEVVESRTERLENLAVAPAQKRFRCGPSREGLEVDASTYQSREKFPGQEVTLEEVGRLQSVRLMRVALRPFQARPADRSLEITTEMVVRVHFAPNGQRTAPAELPRSLYELTRNLAANGQYLRDAVRPAATAETMVIVTADSLKSAIAPLVAWKAAKGLNVKVVTNTEAGGTKDAVKTYLQNLYDSSATKPSFFLFVGNKTTMPGFMESTGSGSAATDYTYALLTGGDAVPDVLYGRIVADNEAEATTQVERWIAYEKTPSAGNWYPQGATISSNEGSNPSDKEYAQMTIDALKANTYKNVDLFNQGDKNATPANINQAVADGRSWLAYWGHGSGTSWGSTNGSYGNSEVAKLSNTGRLPVIIDVACQNGSWVNLTKCFGKAWVTQTSGGQPAGAVAFYGGSVNISWHPPAVMSVGVAKYHFEKPVHTLGGSVLAGQLYLMEKMGTGSNVTDNFKWYNLFGDPSLLVRTDVPKAYDLKHQVRKANAGVAVELTALDNAGAGVKGLLVSVVSQAGATLAVGNTDAQGRASLLIPGVVQLSPNTVLTSTGYNTETHQVVLR